MGIETALLAAVVGSAVIGGASAISQGNAANKVAGIAAGQALAAGETEAAAERRKGNLALGTQRAQFGAMGMDPLGNALDVLQMTAFENELSAQTILTNSRFKAWDYRVQGQAAKKEGQMKAFASFGQAATAMLTGGMGGGGAGFNSMNVGQSYGSQSGAIGGMIGL